LKPSRDRGGGRLAFDPLGGRKKTTAVAESTAGLGVRASDDDKDEEYNEDELNDMSAGLSQLLAELARGNINEFVLASRLLPICIFDLLIINYFI
jgi:hypothetical protein